MSAEQCPHGTEVMYEPCYWCDLEFRDPPHDYNAECAERGHPIYGEQEMSEGVVTRCWCGANMVPAQGSEKDG